MKTVLFIFLLIVSSVSVHAKNDLLFVGFDAGETNIWVQVLKNWETPPNYQILTMATATKVASEAQLNHVIPLESFNIPCPANQRLYELSDADLKKLETLSATIVMTGMYSTPERQITELFSKKGSLVIAVWDNFSTYDNLPADLVANVEKIIQAAFVILVPSTQIANDLNQRFSTDKAIAFGQPTLDLWGTVIAQIDRSAAFTKAALTEDLPILTYISGYEEKGNRYNDSFALFANSLTALDRPMQLFVQLHPRSDGSFEKETLEQLSSLNPHFPKFYISDGTKLSTFEAVAMADLVVCHRSTVAIQALFAGKQSLHVDMPETPFSHFAIEAKLVPQLLSQEAVENYLSSHLQGSVNLSELYEKSGISPNATQSYRSYLKNLIAEASIPAASF